MYVCMYVCMYIMTYESLILIPILKKKKKSKMEFGQSTLNYSNEILFLERPNPNDNFVQISKWSAS